MGRSRRTRSGPPTVRGPGRKSRKQREPVLPRNLQERAREHSESFSLAVLVIIQLPSLCPRSGSEEDTGRKDTTESEAESAERGGEESQGG